MPQTLLQCNRVASWKHIYNVHATIAYSHCWESSRKSRIFSGRLIFLEKPSFTVVALLWRLSKTQNQHVNHLWPADECVFSVTAASPLIGFFVVIVASISPQHLRETLLVLDGCNELFKLISRKTPMPQGLQEISRGFKIIYIYKQQTSF